VLADGARRLMVVDLVQDALALDESRGPLGLRPVRFKGLLITGPVGALGDELVDNGLVLGGVGNELLCLVPLLLEALAGELDVVLLLLDPDLEVAELELVGTGGVLLGLVELLEELLLGLFLDLDGLLSQLEHLRVLLEFEVLQRVVLLEILERMPIEETVAP
jgi:hypothetical protein